MDEFTKTKTAFAAGLLVLVFTAYPVLAPHLDYGVPAFGVVLTLRTVFWIATGLLSLSVYAFALRLLTQGPWKSVERVADFSYALSLVVAPACIALVGLSWIIQRVVPVATSLATVSVLTSLGTLAVAVISVVQAYRVSRILERKTVESIRDAFEREESVFFVRAEGLLAQGYFDLAVIDAFKTLEVAARKYMTGRGKGASGPGTGTPIRALIRAGVLPEAVQPDLEFVQKRRNIAAHALEETSREDAAKVLEITSRLLALLSDTDGEQ